MKKTQQSLCPKLGIKIHDSNNNYEKNPFIQKSQQNVSTLSSNNFDLNIDNYSMKDIFHLFNINSEILDENVMN